jgi:hypothetical protein
MTAIRFLCELLAFALLIAGLLAICISIGL